MLQSDGIAMSSRDMVYYSYKVGFDKDCNGGPFLSRSAITHVITSGNSGTFAFPGVLPV